MRRLLKASPKIGPRLHRNEPVAALVVCQTPSRPREVRVERSRVPIVLVSVASGGVGLPDLDQAVPDRPAIAIEHASRNDDPLSQRLAGMLAGQIVVKLPYKTVPVRRTRNVRERPG
jgi:hypothetical protein